MIGIISAWAVLALVVLVIGRHLVRRESRPMPRGIDEAMELIRWQVPTPRSEDSEVRPSGGAVVRSSVDRDAVAVGD